jgi:cytochrome c556
MVRIALVIAAAVVGTAVLAQSDPIVVRRALMKETGGNIYGRLNRMQRGDAPYDQAIVDAAFVQMADAAQKLPALFPESSKTGGPPNQYSASPKIWEAKADFEARIARYAKDIADNRSKVANLDSLKAVYPVIRRNCDSCHEQYQVRN